MTKIFSVRPGYCAVFGAALVLVAFADFLFFRQYVGISLLFFCAALAMAILVLHPAALFTRAAAARLGALVAALLPLAENVSPLSCSIAFVALSGFALSAAARLRSGIADFAGQALAFLLVAPFRFLLDFFRWRRGARRMGGRRSNPAKAAAWAMPLGLGAVFVALFGAANPVIEYWLSLVDLLSLLERIDVARLVFWLFVLAAVWAFLRPRLPRFFAAPQPVSPVPAPPPAAIDPKASAAIGELVFGRGAILRALIVFNLLFAVQTLLDLAFLWGGVALPDGMTYAAYAHRGAYPLIVTALLAAGFVLAAMRPGSSTSNEPLIRRLVYLFVAQNILLVVSSILRLDLYVGVYALTCWRVAAFVWMGLVAAGLVLIIARIALGKSNYWLFSANLLTLSTALYACSFVNIAALIADYNVDHSFEMTGQGITLDFCYLRSLGPAAFPAIDRLREQLGAGDADLHADLGAIRAMDEIWFRETQANWRAWTFRNDRLQRYLRSQPPLPPVVPEIPTPD